MKEPVVVTNAPVTEPKIRPTARLTEVLNQIAQLQELDDDWDLDGAHGIDPEAIRLASRLVRDVEEVAWQADVPWQPPEIGPVPDGSVALTWEGSIRQALMVFRPGQSTRVECITREEGKQPVRQVVAETEAVQLALSALGSS
jgi:hypothetical protein